jgi:hypothetical protein
VPVDGRRGQAPVEPVGDVALEHGHVFELVDAQMPEPGNEMIPNDRPVAVRGRALQPLRGRVGLDPFLGEGRDGGLRRAS